MNHCRIRGIIVPSCIFAVYIRSSNIFLGLNGCKHGMMCQIQKEWFFFVLFENVHRFICQPVCQAFTVFIKISFCIVDLRFLNADIKIPVLGVLPICHLPMATLTYPAGFKDSATVILSKWTVIEFLIGICILKEVSPRSALPTVNTPCLVLHVRWASWL